MYDDKMVIKRILSAINAKGITKKDTLIETGINTSFLTDWEKGRLKNPGIDKIVSLAEYLNMSLDYMVLGKDNFPPILRDDEKVFLLLYNELDNSGKRLMMNNLSWAVKVNIDDNKYFEENSDAINKLIKEALDSKPVRKSQDNKAISIPSDYESDEKDSFAEFVADRLSSYSSLRDLPVYMQPASAGTGAFLDSDDYDIMEFPFDKVPLNTTFGVRVSGDSMKPDFYNEDIVFVRQQPHLEDGEIGVFMLNSDSYIKKLSKNKQKICLISINPKYEPILVTKFDEFRIIGKVIGVSKDL